MSSELIPYADLQKMARDVVQSCLFPVKNESEAITLFMLCQAEGLHPMRALRMFDIIQGRPAIKPKALMASLTERGGRVEWIRNDAEACIGKFFGRACPDGVVVKFDVTDAKAAGLLNKPGPWQQYRADMLRHRCTGRGVDMVDPAAAFGLYSTPVTQDIVEDSKPVPTEVEVVGTARLQEMDAESRTTAQVIEAARLNRAEAQQYDSGSREWAKPEFCPECGNTDIGEYESTSKQHPGRRYYQCSFAYEERLRMLSEGMNGTKVNAALSKHARKWAEPPIKKEAAGPEPVEIPPVEGHLANAESVAGARTPQAGKQPAPAAESADKWFARERQRITEEVDRRSDLTMSQKMDAIRDALESARKKYDTMLALEG